MVGLVVRWRIFGCKWIVHDISEYDCLPCAISFPNITWTFCFQSISYTQLKWCVYERGHYLSHTLYARLNIAYIVICGFCTAVWWFIVSDFQYRFSFFCARPQPTLSSILLRVFFVCVFRGFYFAIFSFRFDRSHLCL